ncbi:Serine/threonine kinase [Physocladia obscura]|uniref:protein kinase C n=1 Tax=Physocladia obscura TaxID=109957 RepID=A0AAD5T2Y5_9FUNG|nr:Serine/threonine kinase [Physocladia obscura]
MGNAVDKVFTSFGRSLSMLSARSSFVGNTGIASAFGSGASLAGPDLAFAYAVVSDFDFLRCETPLSPEKIAYRIHQIETKLQIERKVQAGTERMCEVMFSVIPAMQNSGAPLIDEKRAKMIEEKLNECREKVALLVSSLARYKLLVVDDKELPALPLTDDDVPFDFIAPTSTNLVNTTKILLSGRLKVTLVGVSGITSGSKPTRPETYAILRVDEPINDLVSAIEKAREIEITIHEKGGSGPIIALIWFTVADLEVLIKHARERRTRDLVNRSDSFIAGNVPEYAATGSGNSLSASPINTPAPPSPVIGGMESNAVIFDGENMWLDLEPSGQLNLKLNFIPETERVKKNLEGIVRNKPVQKVFQKKGHKFVATKFYPVMKCAVCGEFLISSQGYQCQACKYTCHKKCHSKVPTKCITLTQQEQQQSRLSEDHMDIIPPQNRIVHHFEETLNLGVNWCTHCGYMLPLKKRECRRCIDCGIYAHTNCSLLVPNTCGLSATALERIRADREREEKVLRERELAEKEAERIKALAAVRETDGVNISNDFAAFVPTAAVVAGGVAAGAKRKPRPVGLDDFTFLAVLGKGNFGKVMLAEEKTTGKYYAIKVLKKDFIIESDEVEATRSEKRVFMTANIDRFPFLVNLHSCFQTESRLYFVMEFVSGGDLMWHIQQQHFSEERSKFYACEVLLALEHFHKNNIVYRDLKLDNILLTLDGHVKIADYGLCKENMPFGAKTTTFCGTPEFMSPEILQEKPYTRTVDWWAFGVLVYELLFGQAPFKGDDEDQIFDSILYKEPYFSSRADPVAVDLIRKLLIKNPEERLGSGPLDAQEIKGHRFFEGINWDDMVNKRIPPPFIPANTSPTDVSNFDEEFTKEMPILTPCKTTLAAADQEEFRGFTHVSDWANASRNAARKAEMAGRR